MIRVLIVDDSALVRQMLSEILDAAPGITVVGSASDPYVAREKIKQLAPDVITLDVEMPKMDGLTFLRNLMRLRPMPVVMISSLTERGADVTFKALELGAVDFVAKPKLDLAGTLERYSEEIIGKVITASSAKVTPLVANRDDSKLRSPAVSLHGVINATDKIIAIGASTGGTEAIKDVLSVMPADAPGIVVTQHIPESFSASFAQRMDSISRMKVYHAEDGQQILPGHVYIAPGNKHLRVERSGMRYFCRLDDGAAVNRHKPSVDVMFNSVSEAVGHNAIAVLLTGMGNDGAAGMKAMRARGAITLAQDEASSVVWGMPGEAVRLDAVDEILSLRDIAPRIATLLQDTRAVSNG